MQGPNVKELIVEKMSLLMIPPGCKEPLLTGLNALLKDGHIVKVAKEATDWVHEAIKVIRLAKEPNPWRDADDEAIAGEILRCIHEKRKALSSN